MKTFKAALLLFFFFAPHMKHAQSRASDQARLETKNNMSYQRRGLEDAQHEQELEVKSKTEEHTFGKNKNNTKRN
jgi:hypothetical protein